MSDAEKKGRWPPVCSICGKTFVQVRGKTWHCPDTLGGTPPQDLAKHTVSAQGGVTGMFDYRFESQEDAKR